MYKKKKTKTMQQRFIFTEHPTHNHTQKHMQRPTRTPLTQICAKTGTQTQTQTNKKKAPNLHIKTRVRWRIHKVCVRAHFVSALLQKTGYTRRTPKQSVCGLKLLVTAAFSF
jgi:hypothetical protein